jgi:hypothetical protein
MLESDRTSTADASSWPFIASTRRFKCTVARFTFAALAWAKVSEAGRFAFSIASETNLSRFTTSWLRSRADADRSLSNAVASAEARNLVKWSVCIATRNNTVAPLLVLQLLSGTKETEGSIARWWLKWLSYIYTFK